MPSLTDAVRLDVRHVLVSTATPFTARDYRPREVVFSQGDPCDSVMYVEQGRVWLAVTAPSGREAICGLVETAAFVGEEAVAGHAVRRETARAMTATTVLAVPKAQMIQLIRTHEGMSDLFIAHTVARQARLEAGLSSQLLYSSEKRLAYTLLVLARCDERSPCCCVLPDVSQEIIAEMVGTTRSRVNVFLGRFKKRGLIEEDHGRLQVMPSLLQAAREGIAVFRAEHPRPIPAH